MGVVTDNIVCVPWYGRLASHEKFARLSVLLQATKKQDERQCTQFLEVNFIGADLPEEPHHPLFQSELSGSQWILKTVPEPT